MSADNRIALTNRTFTVVLAGGRGSRLRPRDRLQRKARAPDTLA